jgi:hypothetical protein
MVPDSLAVVTEEGDGLRVRTAPGLGPESEALSPLLPAGTRLLVLGGPGSADGHDWYEVLTDGVRIKRYGWVAAGEGGVAWIAPTAPRCWGALNGRTIATLSRIDLLACYHDTELTVRGGELIQVNSIIAVVNPGQDGGVKRLEVTATAPVYVRAFRVNRDGDPNTIPAQREE